MTVLVGYASKHGSTRQIAERIATSLTAAGQFADARAIDRAGDLADYDGFVIGSATYYGHWLKSATEFVHAHRVALAQRPVWLFGSGPLGAETGDEPNELTELREITRARDHQVFSGALDPDGLTFPERTLRRLPAGRALLPEGDFRDWSAIDAWATAIARELTALQVYSVGR